MIHNATQTALAAHPHLDGPRAVFDPSVWIRLPRPGDRCKVSGLSRSTLAEMVRPCTRNDFAPPVESRLLKRRGATRGVLLISRQSLLDYIAGQPAPTRADMDENDGEPTAQADARAAIAASAARVGAIAKEVL